MTGKKTLCLLGLALACGRSTSGTGPGTGNDAAGQGGGADERGTGGSGAGWGPSGELDPIAGEHDVVEAACGGEPIGQEYLVQPNLSCVIPSSSDGRHDTTKIVCEVAAFCTKQSDCTAQPFGRCEGFASVGCHYPAEPCTSDADCTSSPNGRCPVSQAQERCESNERCWPIQRECSYPSGQTCETDVDCNERAGGQCQKLILNARCVYDPCANDGDCAAGQRCGCSNDQRLCVPADCTTDADCGAGQTCRAQNGCFRLEAFHCTTPTDACRSGDDCRTNRCEWAGASWQCNPDSCPLD